jgi:hypothetical protein
MAVSGGESSYRWTEKRRTGAGDDIVDFASLAGERCGAGGLAVGERERLARLASSL